MNYIMLFCFASIASLHYSVADGLKSSSLPSPVRLRYFDAKGAAELCRILLHVGNIPFEDERFPLKQKAGGGFEITEFQEAKSNGAFDANMQRVPILHVGDAQIGQSRAIERYICSHSNLLGSNAEESAQIDCFTENVRDILDKWGKIRSTGGFGPNEEKEKLIQQWFGASSNGKGDYADWLLKLEKSLPGPVDSCFVIGNALSYADVSLWQLLRDFYPAVHIHAAQTAEQAAGCKRLTRIADNVAVLPSLKEYLAKRPVTTF